MEQQCKQKNHKKGTINRKRKGATQKRIPTKSANTENYKHKSKSQKSSERDWKLMPVGRWQLAVSCGVTLDIGIGRTTSKWAYLSPFCWSEQRTGAN